jgi:hypothetical protein
MNDDLLFPYTRITLNSNSLVYSVLDSQFLSSTYCNSLTFILIHPHFIQPLTFILAPTAKITNPITIECLNLETIR